MAEEEKHKHEETEKKKEETVETAEGKNEVKKERKQKEIQKPKKTEAVVNGLSLHMSTKTASYIGTNTPSDHSG